MSDYRGKIYLTADTSDAHRELDRFVKRVDRVGPVRIAIANAGLRQAEQSFTKLQKSIGDLNKTPLNVLTGYGAGSSSRSDSFRQLSQEAKDFFSAIVAGNKNLASTTAGLRQQAQAFLDLADNINFTNQSQKRFFRDFTQGAEIARTKSAKASIEQIGALQDLYQRGITGLRQDISPGAGGLNQLLSLGKDLPRTKTALSEYRTELERVYDLVETRSLSGGIIAVELSNVEKELLKIENDRAEANNQIKGIKAASYALTKNQLFLEEENLAIIERQAAARRRAQQAANDLYNRDKALSRDFGVNPARALRPAGMSDEQVARRNLIVDRTNAAAEASVFNAVSKVAAEIENDLPTLKSIERNRKKIETKTAREAAAAARSANQADAAARSAEFRRTGGLSFDERLARRRPDLAPGFKRQPGFFQGNPRKAISEGLIGGAFPLLFGQGVGASAGGLAGGALGGAIGGSFGFGLSLAGTAVGSAVDTTAQNLKDLASALKSPTDAIAALETSGFRVGDALKLQVQQLQSVGRAYDAQTLVLQEVQKRLGPGSLTELSQLDTAQKRLQEQWSAVTAQIQGELLPVLQGFVEFLGGAANTIGGFVNQNRLQRLDPETFSRLAGQAAKDTGSRTLFGGIDLGKKQQFNARLSELTKQELSKRFQNERAQVPLTPQETFAAETTRIQESRRIADQIQSAYREAFQLQRQAYDLQRDGADLNRDIADYSYKKQREIFDLRQQAAEKEIENNRAAAQNRIERGDLNARQTFAAATGFEQQLLTNVRESMRTREEGEADIEQSRRRLELTMAKLNRDVEDYKRTNAREIEDIERRKLAYTRSVEDYKMRVADYVLQRSRESADLMRQAMTLPDMSGAGGGGGPIGGSKLSQLIGSQESYGGNYGAFNRGGSNQGRTAHGSGIDPNLVNMTIAEIQRRQLAPGVPAGQQLHAVGKYQIIGDTMRSLMQGRYGPTGVSASDRFTPDVQERLGSALARNRVMGKTVEQGMQGLRQEWIGLQNVSDAKLREAVIELQKTGNLQGIAASQISNIPQPQFNQVPIGATPSAASFNAERMAVLSRMIGSEQEAQRILEEQNKLRQKGIELGQIEQILQGNQLPQLQQQAEALKSQLEARRQSLTLSDRDAAVADARAEGVARIAQLEKDRANALAKVQKQYNGEAKLAEQVNKQADAAIKIAKGEEDQRIENLEAANQLQNLDRARAEILSLDERLAVEKAQAAALERGELEASNVELLKASTLYRDAEQAQKDKLVALTAETEELRKQNDFRKRINELDKDIRFTGAGLRAGFVGGPARAFEQGLKDFNGDMGKATDLANRTRLLEDQQATWGNLERNIVDVSDAISGGLTNGLLDIVSGARQIEDVGRDMLNSIARSFATSAEQQLGTLMQRQLGGLLGGAQGPLVKMLGAGGEMAGSQALGAASVAASGSLWGVSTAAAAAGVALQTIAAQAAFSGGLGSLGGVGQIFSGAAPSLFSKANPDFIPSIAFGGFLANGGTARPGQGYIVGEEEPEFFFPGVSGRVVPRSDMQKAEELRQGSEQSEPIDVRYTVTERHGERYVTEQQFREGMERTSKRAQAMTYAGMRNNKEVRSFVDI